VEEFIDRLSTSASLDRAAAQRAAFTFLNIAKRHLSASVATDLFHALPDAKAFIEQGGEQPRPASGLEEMMSSAIKNALGVEDPLVAIIGDLKAAGLTSNQALLAGQEFLRFAQEKAGPSVIARMTDEIPGLRRIN